MAQHKVGELSVQSNALQALVRRPSQHSQLGQLATLSPQFHGALARFTASWLPMAGISLAAMGAGLVLLGLGGPFAVIWVANLLLSAGLMLGLLTLLRRFIARQLPVDAGGPAPEPVDAKLLAERSRRVRAILGKVSSASQLPTFEQLVQESRWTQAAMLSTLTHMKDRGEIIEDLNLDTGEWVYSLADDLVGTGLSSLNLDERTVEASALEQQG